MVASFEQLIKGTNSNMPCTRPRVFLLAFLETNPCPTLYPTLCFWKQLRGRGILRSQALVRGRRKKSLVHTVCACSVPPGFLGILEISVKPVRYTNLRKTCRLFTRERCLPLTTLCVDDDEGAIKAISSLLTGIIHASVRSS